MTIMAASLRGLDLVDEAIRQIETGEQEWDQRRWDRCIAGIMCRITGARWATRPDGSVSELGLVPEEGEETFDWDGNPVMSRAERLLGDDGRRRIPYNAIYEDYAWMDESRTVDLAGIITAPHNQLGTLKAIRDYARSNA